MHTEKQFHLVGWILFVICAVLFIISSLKSGDVLLLAGSVIFLLACVFFLLPLLKSTD